MTPIDDFAPDAAALAGPLEGRLRALREAGFARVTLQARDLAAHAGGFDAAVAAVRSAGLRVAAFQALRDFEGLGGPSHDYKVQIAKSMLQMCRAVGSPLLLACASTAPQAGADPARLAGDLRKLALLAVPLGIRIAYQAQPGARHAGDYRAAWDLVARADCPNLGLALDAGPAAAAGIDADSLFDLDVEKLFLVQLADALCEAPAGGCLADGAAPGASVYPGEGVLAARLAEQVVLLDRLGYRGDHAFDVRDPDGLQLPPATVAQRARRAAEWLAEDVLRRSAPLPNRMKLRGA